MRNIVSVVFVALFTWCITLLYHFLFEISSISEFVLVFIVTGLLINGIYFVGSIMILKQKFRKRLRKKIRLDADRRIQENPDNVELRILYGTHEEMTQAMEELEKRGRENDE